MKIGNIDISKMYIGSSEISKLYLGSTLVYDNIPPLAPFIIQVKTDNVGTSLDTQFTIPTGTETYLYDVSTSDGQTILGNIGNLTITFPSAGTYDVSISGNFPSIFFNDGGDKSKLIDIKQWGEIAWKTMYRSFRGCNQLTTVTATDIPNLIDVTRWTDTFRSCTNLISLNVVNWDMSSADRLDIMFRDSTSLTTLDVSNWDVSNATNMSAMFYNTNLTTIDVSNWDVSNVTLFTQMFRSNTNSIVNLDVSNWVTTSATDMSLLFYQARVLNNVDVSNFDMNGVTTVRSMFYQCYNFDRSLANWDISTIADFGTSFIIDATLSTANYDATLISWAGQVPQLNQVISFGNSRYSYGGAAEAARNTLINTYGWTITDGGSNNQIINGTFDTASDWTVQDSWSIGSGVATYDGVITSKKLSQILSITDYIEQYDTYVISFDISNVAVAEDAYFAMWGSGSGNPNLVSYRKFQNGSHIYAGVNYNTGSAASFLVAAINSSTGGAFSIDNIVMVGSPQLETTEIASNIAISNDAGAIATLTSPLNYNCTSDGTSGSTIRPSLSFSNCVTGVPYEMTLDISNLTGDTRIDIYNGSTYQYSNYTLTDGIWKFAFTMGAVSPFMSFDGTVVFNCDIGISIKEITI